MQKAVKIAIIIVAALLLSAVILMMARVVTNTPEEAPQFVYTTASTTQTTTSAAAQSTTAATTQPTEEQPPEEAEIAVLLTSNDPENYFELAFSEDTIYIKGRYIGAKVDVFIAGVGYAHPVYSADGSFTTEFAPLLDQEYHSLTAVLENGASLNWRVQKRGDGARLVICGDVMEQNEKARLHILDIPEDIVADYIVTGGSDEQRTEVLTEISAIAEQVCEGLESDYDKARALAQWVSQNIYYDYDAYYSSVTTETLSLESTLSLHRSVCGGYANLYAALCQSQGIECYIAQGNVVQNYRTFLEADDLPSHEWNLVRIDDRFFWVDTLWNNSGNQYYKGEYYDGSPSLRYFDPTEEIMAQDHKAMRIEKREFYKD